MTDFEGCLIRATEGQTKKGDPMMTMTFRGITGNQLTLNAFRQIPAVVKGKWYKFVYKETQRNDGKGSWKNLMWSDETKQHQIIEIPEPAEAKQFREKQEVEFLQHQKDEYKKSVVDAKAMVDEMGEVDPTILFVASALFEKRSKHKLTWDKE